jgi:chaperonin GroEL (HSP60 family)
MHHSSAHRLQVITLAGELLDKAGSLLREGLTTTEVADGYQLAGEKVRCK